MAIVWRDQMSIDGGVIDNDHKYLIAIVNDVDAVGPGPSMPEQLAAILARLDLYAQVHFEREERLQLATGFTYASAHHSRHVALVRELDAMRAECDKAATPQEMLAFQLRLGDFLHRWLVDHIIKADVLMKPFVVKMQLHAGGMGSLAEAVQRSDAGNG
jgi:hemerythrin